MRQGLDWHSATKDSHRRSRYRTAREDDTMYMVLLNLLADADTFFKIHTPEAVVPHIGLHHYCHIIAGMLHHSIEHFIHEPTAVFKRTTILIASAIGARTQELRNQISMAAMNLHAIKAAFASKIHSLTKLTYNALDFIHLQRTMERRRIEVQSCTCAHGQAMASLVMRHITAMAELNRHLGSFRMNRIRKMLQRGFGSLCHYQLSIKRATRLLYCTISYRSHTYPTTSYRNMVVFQLLSGFVVFTHVLKCSRTNKAVAKRDRTKLIRSKKFIFHN